MVQMLAACYGDAVHCADGTQGSWLLLPADQGTLVQHDFHTVAEACAAAAVEADCSAVHTKLQLRVIVAGNETGPA